MRPHVSKVSREFPWSNNNNNNNNNNNKGVKIANIAHCEEPKEKNAFKREVQNEYFARWTGKRMYGQFVREMPESVDKDRTWEWMRKSDLKLRLKH